MYIQLLIQKLKTQILNYCDAESCRIICELYFIKHFIVSAFRSSIGGDVVKYNVIVGPEFLLTQIERL